jgi:hypothetical protein
MVFSYLIRSPMFSTAIRPRDVIPMTLSILNRFGALPNLPEAGTSPDRHRKMSSMRLTLTYVNLSPEPVFPATDVSEQWYYTAEPEKQYIGCMISPVERQPNGSITGSSIHRYQVEFTSMKME